MSWLTKVFLLSICFVGSTTTSVSAHSLRITNPKACISALAKCISTIGCYLTAHTPSDPVTKSETARIKTNTTKFDTERLHYLFSVFSTIAAFSDSSTRLQRAPQETFSSALFEKYIPYSLYLYSEACLLGSVLDQKYKQKSTLPDDDQWPDDKTDLTSQQHEAAFEDEKYTINLSRSQINRDSVVKNNEKKKARNVMFSLLEGGLGVLTTTNIFPEKSLQSTILKTLHFFMSIANFMIRLRLHNNNNAVTKSALRVSVINLAYLCYALSFGGILSPPIPGPEDFYRSNPINLRTYTNAEQRQHASSLDQRGTLTRQRNNLNTSSNVQDDTLDVTDSGGSTSEQLTRQVALFQRILDQVNIEDFWEPVRVEKEVVKKSVSLSELRAKVHAKDYDGLSSLLGFTVTQEHINKDGRFAWLSSQHGKPTCPICFTDVEKKCAILSCGHVFCESCLDKWSNANASKYTCPTCRKEYSACRSTCTVSTKSGYKKPTTVGQICCDCGNTYNEVKIVTFN